ncbi:palmitoyl-protein thioesterase 1 isoform X2 [Lycorma delicatula]|uniref:palmitoyl-protein thioesterase 1 isoform X2 n=1 Tax=Lycorma delicatula TaxID=130591 RepID=UPI003F5148FE
MIAVHQDKIKNSLLKVTGDSCCNPLSLDRVKKHIQEELGPDKQGKKIYINSLKIGNSFLQETMNGYFMNVNDQISEACAIIKNDSQLSYGYNAIGFSQGSQFLRAVAQRCPEPKMLNLISIGGQHQGVYGLPHCNYPDHSFCDNIRRILNAGAYLSWVQDYLVQAEYWHDPLNEEEYKERSVFLADINNEKKINIDYIKNLQSLNNIVFVKFNNDTMVMPKESEWFGFYSPGQVVNITDLWNSKLYIEDRLGLQKMRKDGKLHFLAVDGDHLRFNWDWFLSEIIHPYIKNMTI